MSRFDGLLKLVLVSALAGCGFNPGEAGAPTGAGASSGSGTGAGGTTGVGASSGIGASPGIGLSSGAGGDVGIGGSSCGQTSVQVMPEPPDILIVQDKSLSMNQDATGQDCTTAGCSKWSQVSTAMDAVVQATDTNVNWGLVFFGTNSSCGVTSTPVVPVGAMNGQRVTMAFATNQPSSYTPTATAVDAAVTYMKTLKDTNPKYLLLATDGLPNCGANSRQNMTADDSPAAEAAVMNARNAGFPTFVVGIATDSDQMATNTLNTMAVNGGFPQSGAATQYYSVSDTASLEGVLNQIVGMVASCTIPLTNVPSNLTNVAVSAQDASGKPVEIKQDPANGWSYTNGTMNVIKLNGSACDNLQNGTYSNVQFLYACEGTIICIDRNPDGSCGDHPM